MEAGEPSARQSGIPPALSSDHFHQISRERVERQYSREIPAMATASLISPTSHYNPHLPSLSSHYHHNARVPPSAPGMIPPGENRRISDEHEAPPRQSLPSLSEVISGNQSPYGAPPSGPPPGAVPPNQSLPSPFGSSFSSRSFSDAVTEKHPSPRAIHPPTSLPRPDAFSDQARLSLTSRPAPPSMNAYGPHVPAPPRMELERREIEQRQAESRQSNSGYPHAPGPSTPGLYPQTGRLPPGQLPLSGYPVSPRAAPQALPSPFEGQRQSIQSDEADYAYSRAGDYKGPSDRPYEGWSYTDALSTISETGRTLHNFADAYDAAAREQQGSQPILSRLPTEREVTAMLDNVVNLQKKLEEIREMVMQNRLNHERARAFGARKGFDDDDASMYHDGFKQPFALSEAKKRRGRAAPPGRCHSCNRIDTPEWRRGPDGARTLCNACGLHYAKLERKRQLDKAVRKPVDDRGP